MFQSRHLQPVDDQIKTKYYLSSLILFPIIFMAAILNYSQDLHMFPPHENCLRSEIIVNPFKFFFSFIFPLIIILGLNLFFDSNQWQRPQRNHIYMKDIYSVIYNQIRIKSSTLTVLLLLVIMPGVLKSFNCLELSTNMEGMLIASLLLLIFIAKGPCMLFWTCQTDHKNLKEAQHNLRILELELQYL